MGSEEFHSASLPTAQEAAILYAANQLDAAIQLLKHEIKEPAGGARRADAARGSSSDRGRRHGGRSR